jgi:Flp pilus assembly protein TadG
MSIGRLLGNDRGASLVEFAIMLPVILTIMMGLGELAYQEYVQSVLTGAVQKAARDQGIEGNVGSTDAIDAKVEAAVSGVVRNPVFNARSTRRVNYDNYSQTAGEPFTDKKYPADNTGTFDGICNHGETYVDVNGNGQYDLNLGQTGQGGASDLVQYTVTVAYKRLFPVVTFNRSAFGNWSTTANLTASTMFRNQPYAVQSQSNGTSTGICS